MEGSLRFLAFLVKKCTLTNSLYFRFSKEMVSSSLVIPGSNQFWGGCPVASPGPLLHRRGHRLLDHHPAVVDVPHHD